MTKTTRHRATLFAGLLVFVLAAWWAYTASRTPSGFDWQREQRAYFARTGKVESPHVVRRLIVADASGAVVEEQCETCHIGARDAAVAGGAGNAGAPSGPSAPHPGGLLAMHPKSVGCTHCHGGAPAELSTAAHDPSDSQGARESVCARCHDERLVSRDPARNTGAAPAMARAARGRALYDELGCAACHGDAASSPPRPGLSRPPAPLADIDLRRTPEHVQATLTEPSKIASHGAMPRYFAGRNEDALAVTAYLFSEPQRASTWSREDVDGRANVPGTSAEEGAKLYAALGCRACHRETEDDAGPASRSAPPSRASMGRGAREDYLASYLRAPSRAHPRSRMPSFRLDAREAASVALYVAKKSDPTLPVTTENARLLHAASLASERVTCGAGTEMPRAECGKLLYARARCAACHGQISREPAREGTGDRVAEGGAPEVAATLGTLRGAKSFHATARASTDLTYALADDERAALATFIDGRAAPPPPLGLSAKPDRDAALADTGARLVRELRCDACHDGLSRAAGVPARRVDATGLTDAARAPPSLEDEGARARPEWLFAFLQRPHAFGVRPALHPEWVYGALPPLESLAPRMPGFDLDEEELTALVRFFTRASGASYPFSATSVPTRSPEDRLAALVLLNRGDDKTRCNACHYVGDPPKERMKADAASLAPSFGTLAMRRRPAWVSGFLGAHDASHADGRAGAPRALSDKEIALLTDVLFSLDDRAHLPHAGDEARAPLP